MTLDDTVYQELLGKRPKLCERSRAHVTNNYCVLQSFGFTDAQILGNTVLLDHSPSTLKRRYAALCTYVDRAKIPSRGRLLRITSADIRERYNGIRERVPARIIRAQPQLLQLPLQTFVDSHAWHVQHDVCYGAGSVLGVSAHRKSEKVNYVMDLKTLPWDGAIKYFRAKPSYLQKSLSCIENYVIGTNT